MCHSKLHKDIISYFDYNWSGIGLYDYLECEQNRIFMILNETLLIVDSTNYVRVCPQCDMLLRIYFYGKWPNVRASFDGVTDLPICAIIPGVKTLTRTTLYCEPSFGKFIYTGSMNPDINKYAIIYYPTGNIEYKKDITNQGTSIDGKPVVCCRTIDNKYIIINSDGKIPDVEIVYSTDNNSDVFKIGNGTLQYEYGFTYKWVYTANPALKTKPAAPSE